MGYFRVTTTRYEKYLGMKNGVEYGWSLTYPVISGLADKTVQAKVNNAIETFFLEGPSFSAQREALTRLLWASRPGASVGRLGGLRQRHRRGRFGLERQHYPRPRDRRALLACP